MYKSIQPRASPRANPRAFEKKMSNALPCPAGIFLNKCPSLRSYYDGQMLGPPVHLINIQKHYWAQHVVSVCMEPQQCWHLLAFVAYSLKPVKLPGGGTPYIRMIEMIVIFFRGYNRRFSIFRGCFGIF